MPIGATFHDWSEATLTSLGSALALLLAAIPKIIGFVLIVLIGWFIASLIQRAVAGVARRALQQPRAPVGLRGFRAAPRHRYRRLGLPRAPRQMVHPADRAHRRVRRARIAGRLRRAAPAPAVASGRRGRAGRARDRRHRRE